MQAPQILLSHKIVRPTEPFDWDEGSTIKKNVQTICEKWVEYPEHTKIYVDSLNEWLRRVPEEYRLEWFLFICRSILYTIRLHALNGKSEEFLEVHPVQKLCSMDMVVGLRAKAEYVTWFLGCLNRRLPTDHSGSEFVVEKIFLDEMKQQLSG